MQSKRTVHPISSPPSHPHHVRKGVAQRGCRIRRVLLIHARKGEGGGEDLPRGGGDGTRALYGRRGDDNSGRCDHTREAALTCVQRQCEHVCGPGFQGGVGDGKGRERGRGAQQDVGAGEVQGGARPCVGEGRRGGRGSGGNSRNKCTELEGA